MSTIAAIPESAARFQGDLEHIRRFNFALSIAERRAADGLVWEQSDRDWGTLRTATGKHVCYGATCLDALRTAAGVVS